MRVPLLMYHKVAPRPSSTLVPGHYVHPRRFRAHLRALLRFGFEAKTFGEAVEALRDGGTPGSRPIVLTFDDGYENFALNAAPAMVAAGVRGTVFVVTGLLGGHNEWDAQDGDAVEPLMSPETLRNLSRRGFELGSHSETHARLPDLSDEHLARELVRSRDVVESLSGIARPVFCYPYGAHDGRVRGAVRDAGYAAACTVEKGWNARETDVYRWRRVNVRGDTTTPVLFWKLWCQARTNASDP